MPDKDLYVDFENTFRGSRDAIKNRLSAYDGLLNVILDKNQKPTALDIGCGRGEWLQKCHEQGFEAIGIDVNHEMVEFTNNLGLNVELIDANSFVEGCDESSFNLITLFHIIEHLEQNDLFNLLLECQRILKPNGVILIETPNIDNIQVSTKTFYLDPTHIRPINPDYISFLFKKCGFFNSKYYFINSEIAIQDSGVDRLINLYKGVGYDLLFIATNSSKIDIDLFQENTKWIDDINVTLGTDELLRRIDQHYFDRFKYMEQQLNKLAEIESKINSLYRIIRNLKLFYISDLIDDLRTKGLVRFCLKKLKAIIRKIFYLIIKYSKILINVLLFKSLKKKREDKNIIYNKNKAFNYRFFFMYKFYPKAHSIYAKLQSKLRNKK